ncbi:hypothetical protein GCM10007392_23460 [Saccharospirillum salsuginis]|uniref:PilX/PilW C-terminal domain-containing protein n=2 Tax=Saccharospirillum salsuginis TaxID=418750 RepID=A0A918NB42_9GAMM|nr:hypothetical protein GCM10007392_23460 [Saccharospirillum salsuginis]
MTGNATDRNVAFQAAEAALSEAESFLFTENFSQPNFYTNNCSETHCFVQDGEDGLFFKGEFLEGGDCTLDSVASPDDEIYQDSSIWTTGSGKYRQADIELNNMNLDVQARYIIEFRCFAVKTPDNIPAEQYDDENRYDETYWEPFYRITAYATGRTPSARVMLQSTYRRD